jgi:hypothetical protein
MARYDSAAVCRRGHVFTAHLERAADVAERCTKCGAEIITTCSTCEARIRGLPANVSAKYLPPDFCDVCGSPFPWLSRQGLIYQLQNMLDEEELDPATRLEVREQLEALAAPELDDEEQLRRWARVKELAPGLWRSSERILVTVVSAAIKDKLGI